VVIAFAAARPEQVRRLVLWHPWASWRQFARYSTLPALRGMFDDWSLYAETAGRLLAGPDSDTAREMIDAILALDPAQVRRSLESRHQIEIEDVLPHVACPTLVLHRSGNPVTDVRASREVAARIPDARLLVLEGRGTIPPVGDDGAALRAIQSFLTEAEGAFAPPGTASPPSVGVSTPTTLTPREREVLGQIAEGKTNAQIAEQLVIAQNTVASHVKHILEKLEAANRTEAVRIATRLGLLQ
jgi:DNA-binding CsgD family transcriptional regulator